MLPVAPCRVTNPFAAPGSYASIEDRHGPKGHHTGIDYGSAWPTPIVFRKVRAALGGEVVISGYNTTMGNWVGVYSHDHDVLITYWHLASRAVDVGDWVLPYAVLGRVGNTGNSTAAHLHVQANRGQTFDYRGHIDPAPFLSIVSRPDARAAYRANPVHPQAAR